MPRLPNLVLALLSGLLLATAWYTPFTVLIFVALVPLLILQQRFEEDPERTRLQFTGLSYLCFFTWNLITTWWTAYASLGGACLAILANSLIMCMTFGLYRSIKRRINKPWGIWLLIPIWMTFEYLHTLWDLTWTWLTLGNIFAFTPGLIQWYEFTGVSGGTLWILVLNILVFKFIQLPKRGLRQGLPLAIVLVLPVLLSLLFGAWPRFHKGVSAKVVIVQPNLDPYTIKFNQPPQEQLAGLMQQIQGKVDSTTDYLVLPETFLTENMWEDNLAQHYSVSFLKDNLIRKYPKLKIVTGASTRRQFMPGEPLSSTARRFADAEQYYDDFNTALQIDSSTRVQVYHKSKLVPGVERMPFPFLLKPLENLALDMGGTTGSLGTQEERSVLFNADSSIGVAPVICYESVYGDFITGYMRKGANMIFIITNDGWWDDTPGYKQHLAYGRLRAIENRCSIARSANTGISCFIDPYGNISEATPWWQPAVIEARIAPATGLTFYGRFGDLLSYTAVAIAFGLILMHLLLHPRWRKPRKSLEH